MATKPDIRCKNPVEHEWPLIISDDNTNVVLVVAGPLSFTPSEELARAIHRELQGHANDPDDKELRRQARKALRKVAWTYLPEFDAG